MKIKTTNFVCENNLAQYTDSMLFDSGEVIASADFIAQGRKCSVDLVVHGNVKVFYKGTAYKSASEFPEELKELIRTDKYWDCHEDIEVAESNWFEYLAGDEYGMSEGVVCESDISKMSVDDLHSEMLNIAEWFLSGDNDEDSDE